MLLADDGSPVLMDFGSCAKARKTVDDRKGALALEDDASVKCSAPYRAPELTEVRRCRACFSRAPTRERERAP